MALQVTTWNLEHAGRLVGENSTAQIDERRRRVRDTIKEIDPDILCIQEGPKGEQAIDAFCTQVLERRWVPVLLRQEGEALGVRDREYQIKGTQWIWFLVRAGLEGCCRLQPPQVWQAFTRAKNWLVNMWGVETCSSHLHYRHPQVMIYDLGDGYEIEFIGAHLKSKINQEPIERDPSGNLVGAYVREALEARIKLATEARDIRGYVAAKFDQVAQPGLVVMGDYNDGPGHDFFETQYLFFDLISNVQGDVMLAERFFHHILFDFPGHLRWTARFADEILHLSASRNPLLLDHILISQPLRSQALPLVVKEHAGRVEHEAYERNNAGCRNATRTSDHRPITCLFEEVVR